MWSRVYFADGAPYLMTTTSYGTRLRAQEADTKVMLLPETDNKQGECRFTGKTLKNKALNTCKKEILQVAGSLSPSRRESFYRHYTSCKNDKGNVTTKAFLSVNKKTDFKRNLSNQKRRVHKHSLCRISIMTQVSSKMLGHLLHGYFLFVEKTSLTTNGLP